MAIADVTKQYVDLISNSKYAQRTSDNSEFEAVRELQAEYLNTNVSVVPDTKYNRLLALLICHYYAIDDTQDPDIGGADDVSGLATTTKVGDVSEVRSLPYLADVKGSNMYLLRSVYGMEFLYVMKSFKSSIFTT